MLSLLTVIPNPGRLAAVRHAFHDIGLPQPNLLNDDGKWQIYCPTENVQVLEATVAGKATVIRQG